MKDTREKILQAAQELFARRGYEATGLSKIANRVGITKASLYYYFHSKEELYAALVERYVGELNDRLEPVLKQSGPEQKLDALIRGYLGLLQGKRDLAQAVSRELFGGMATPLGPLAQRVEERVLRSVQKVIEEGVSTGTFRPVDPRLAAFSLLGMLHVFLAEEPLTGEVTPPRELADHTVSMATAALSPNPVMAERR